MDPISAAIAASAVSGLSNLAGTYMTNQANARAVENQNTANREIAGEANLMAQSNQREANAMNLQIARENTAFQERMSSTAYQRAMIDMKKAGLNPMLAFMKGGASTPSGSTATMGAAPVQSARAERPNYMDPIGPAANSAMDAFTKIRQLQQTQEGLGIQKANSVADVAMKAAQSQSILSTAKKTEAEIGIIKSRAIKQGLEADWYSGKEGKDFYKIERMLDLIGNGLDAAGSAKDLITPNLLKYLGRGGKKLNKRLNPKTGEEEIWMP